MFLTTEAVNHDTPKEILGDVLALEERIVKKTKALQSMLK